ncbi:ribose/proton symporter RbsU [Companilactobacillus sp.]|uniref:ribose/proton symporter RbsU n=1 Tax=Companilactobacillus sp. TaxID=2767905 RepID=UPI0025B94BD4|nr:GRP family sugar transporter [Companilactobacillus sp.]MCH4008285.1 GRP family sugar transporter [Companilactobacillus sp.]MCH4051536.1 GRP family sugar transporter [Companilactobacillus sp.]MCH4076228.1 GRP family sugar transporter [Companilactobacillus sp.]MCH4124803.1 GRP family sugar transporter [Companilactobacillus sp.]MCH4131345.1 GRP family sugar transporter [Companilactobacillus sp.]
MSITNILIGLIPMIGWGVFPVLTGYFGGKPVNQILGATYGTLIGAIVVALFTQTPLLTGKEFLFTFLSGMAWSIGQIFVFYAFTEMGVSRTMPISTGFQLIGASLWGVIVLGEWRGNTFGMSSLAVGFFAIVLIIVGVWFTTYTEGKTKSAGGTNAVKGVALVFCAEIGYLAYSAFPQAVKVTGFEAFLPQALGMAVAATIFALATKGNRASKPFRTKSSYTNIISGFFFALAALTYLISARPEVNGLATGFTLSQMNVILATLGGIYILHERKTKKEMGAVLAGLLLVVIAGVLTAFIN